MIQVYHKRWKRKRTMIESWKRWKSWKHCCLFLPRRYEQGQRWLLFGSPATYSWFSDSLIPNFGIEAIDSLFLPRVLQLARQDKVFFLHMPYIHIFIVLFYTIWGIAADNSLPMPYKDIQNLSCTPLNLSGLNWIMIRKWHLPDFVILYFLMAVRC